MLFKPYLIEKIMLNQKTQTRRILQPNWIFYQSTKSVYVRLKHRDRLKWKAGNYYSACPGRGKFALCSFKILDIRIERASQISTPDAIAEGFSSPHDFLEAWDTINGTGKRDLEVVVLTFVLRELALQQEQGWLTKPVVAYQERLF